MENVSFFDPSKEIQAKRKKKLAEAIMKSAQQPQGTEVVSGYAVKQSPIAGLARALQSGLAGYQEGQADKLEEESALQRAKLMAEALNSPDNKQAAQLLAQDPESQAMALKIGFPTAHEGATSALADRLISAGVPELDALLIAKSGAGVGRGYDPSAGKITPMAGAPEAAKALKYGEKTGSNLSDLEFEPQIKEASAYSAEVGQGRGEAKAKLDAMEAQQPRLEEVVTKLSDLGKKATYTYAGQAINSAKRQAGLPVGKGAVARTEYMSTVDNEVLPLLRQTFGAQFTVEEGTRLRATLGDANKSPEEKDAVLRAFIQQKQAQIETLKRQTGEVSGTKQQIHEGWPDATKYMGKIITDADTGAKYRSDGKTWVPQ